MTNATKAQAYDWSRFRGSVEALKWNRRDLPNLDAVIALTRGRTACVQAGGHLGVWPKRLAAHFAAVYTFEPAGDLFADLCRNAPETNIVKMQAAVGFDRGLVGLSRVRRDGKANVHPGITHVLGDGAVPVLRIDDLALQACDLVCLDIEGFELFALQGAEETIRRCRPVLAVEINRNIGFVGHTGDEVRSLIRALGYREVQQLQSDVVFLPEEWS